MKTYDHTRTAVHNRAVSVARGSSTRNPRRSAGASDASDNAVATNMPSVTSSSRECECGHVVKEERCAECGAVQSIPILKWKFE
jgi:hypothetical protein